MIDDWDRLRNMGSYIFDYAELQHAQAEQECHASKETTTHRTESPAVAPELQELRDRSGTSRAASRTRARESSSAVSRMLSRLSLCRTSAEEIDSACIGPKKPSRRSAAIGRPASTTSRVDRTQTSRVGSHTGTNPAGDPEVQRYVNQFDEPVSPGTLDEHAHMWRWTTDHVMSAVVPFSRLSHFTASEIEPYIALEQQHPDLFSSSAVTEVALGTHPFPGRRTLEVQANECTVINTARDWHDCIGASHLAASIAIIARGTGRHGERILGLYHHDGNTPASNALSQLKFRMRRAGALDQEMFLIGGLISKAANAGTAHIEREFLRHRHEFNINAAKLHVNTQTEIDGDAEHVNVLATADQILYGRCDLYVAAVAPGNLGAANVQAAADIIRQIRQFSYNQQNFKSDNKFHTRRDADLENQRVVNATAELDKVREQGISPWYVRGHNCGELAEMAKFLGRQNGLEVHGVGGETHGFAVIGRLPPSRTLPSDMSQWPAELAVCDPWANIACAPRDYPRLFRAKMQKWRNEGKEIYDGERGDWIRADHPRWIDAVLNGPKPVDHT